MSRTMPSTILLVALLLAATPLATAASLPRVQSAPAPATPVPSWHLHAAPAAAPSLVEGARPSSVATASSLIHDPGSPTPFAFPFSAEHPVTLATAPGGQPTRLQGPQNQADGTAPAASSAAAAGDYSLTFRCPAAVESDVTDNACPAYVLDVEDVMGQPVLAVDPNNPDLVAFNALHGGPGVRVPTQQPVPSEHSRDNAVHQPHTTFQSTDSGAVWQDNRYYARLADKAEVFGEDNAMVADRQGRLTIASLYAFREQPEGSGDPIVPDLPGPPLVPEPGTGAELETEYAVILWTAGRIDRLVDYDKQYSVKEVGAGSVARSLHLAYVPESDTVVALWLVRGADGKSWVDLYHRSAGDEGSAWERQAGERRIEHCSDISNPIAVAGRLIVGCFAEASFVSPDANPGQLQLIAIETQNWTSTRIGAAPAFVTRGYNAQAAVGQTTGNAVLATAERVQDGGFVLGSAGVREGSPFAQVTFGLVAGDSVAWSPTKEYGRLLVDTSQVGRVVREARINALAFMASSATVHLLFMERFAVQGSAAGSAQEYYKSYGVVHHTGRFLGSYALAVGSAPSRANFPPQVAGPDSGVFNDLHDSFVVHRVPDGTERLFVAYGDYGFVRYAEVQEQEPPLPGFPPIAPTLAVPAAATSANPAVVGAVAGALALAILARLALARAKRTAEATA